MPNPLRNLRLPGTKPRRYRGRAPLSSPPARRQYALSRVEPARPRREVHLPWRRIGLTVAGVAALGGSVYGAAWLVTGDTLRVHQIDVNGSSVVSPFEVAAAAGVGGDSMLTLDLVAAEAAIEALPGVKDATVERTWPQAVRVTLVEHQAWGFWQAGGHVYVIDRDGQVLQAGRPAPQDAPRIIDLASPRDLQGGQVGDPDTVRLVARLQDDRVFESAGLRPTAWVFQRDRGLTVVAEDGPDAVFGDSSNYEFKVKAFEQVLRQLRAREATGSPQVAEVDLRFGRNVVLR